MKLVANRFKQKIKAEKLCMPYFMGTINAYYVYYLHEMNVLQDDYDSQTRHGLNEYEQEKWNNRIDRELAQGNPS